MQEQSKPGRWAVNHFQIELRYFLWSWRVCFVAIANPIINLRGEWLKFELSWIRNCFTLPWCLRTAPLSLRILFKNPKVWIQRTNLLKTYLHFLNVLIYFIKTVSICTSPKLHSVVKGLKRASKVWEQGLDWYAVSLKHTSENELCVKPCRNVKHRYCLWS